MMSTLLSHVALKIVIMTTCDAISDDKVGIMTTHNFHISMPEKIIFILSNLPDGGECGGGLWLWL